MAANISNPRHDSTSGEREVCSRGKGGGTDDLPARSGSPESAGCTERRSSRQSPVAAQEGGEELEVRQIMIPAPIMDCGH